jgi:hypothetical protein
MARNGFRADMRISALYSNAGMRACCVFVSVLQPLMISSWVMVGVNIVTVRLA